MLVYRQKEIKQLQQLSPSEKKKVLRKLESLATDPLIGKPLRGELEGLRSLRAWPYRIIYENVQEKIRILSIAHRRDVYR